MGAGGEEREAGDPMKGVIALSIVLAACTEPSGAATGFSFLSSHGLTAVDLQHGTGYV